MALQLAGPATCNSIDRLLEQETVLDRDQAQRECETTLETLAGDRRKPIQRLLKRLRTGQVPDSHDAVTGLGPALAPWAATMRELQDVASEERRRISERIRDVARDSRFREALAWQNLPAVRSLLDPILATPAEVSDSSTRQKEAKLASYVQRYCMKNDSIGFFGPIGWAYAVDGAPALCMRPGERLVELRRVYFEYWCIDTFAAKLASDHALRIELAPRRMPTVRLEGSTLYHPVDRSTRLEPAYVALVEACDGERSARAIAGQLGALGLSEGEVYEMLDELVALRVIRWTLEIPTAGLHPERHLERLLDQLPAGGARERAHRALATLEAGRDAVARAAGDPHALEQALVAFEELFTNLTETPANRRAGEMYAARTLLFEDTRRDVELELGAGFFDRLGPPLTLVMQSARWYTHAVATAYRPVFRAVYEQLREQTGTPRVDYLHYLEQIHPHFASEFDVAPTVRPVIDELHARWKTLLGVGPQDRRIERRASDLHGPVRTAFAAPCPGWPEARFHSPDIMVAAAGREAFARGELFCVVNEIHAGVHTFTRPVFFEAHPDPEAMNRARRADLGQPVLKPVEARANALRIGHFPSTPDDIDIETNDARSWRAPDNVLQVAHLVVEDVDGQLVVRTRDGQRSFDIVRVFEMHLQLACASHFTLLPPLAHTPRVAIDKLVIARESWRFDKRDVAFADASGIDRLVGARRWMREHALPRFVFVRVAHEIKPCFIDLESPVYLELLCRFIRKASSVTVAEMLPTPDQMWLVDRAGETYSCELRMALVDPERWRPAARR